MAKREEDTTVPAPGMPTHNRAADGPWRPAARLRRAVARVLRKPATSKRAKVAAGRALTQTVRQGPPRPRPPAPPRPQLPHIDVSAQMPAVKIPRP